MSLTFEEACKVLEVSPEASEAEVKTAYRKLAMKWHPDKHEGPDKENATQRFQQVSAAYQKLTTPEEDSIEIGDFHDAFQFFMRIFMAHCQDECFFDDDLEYDDDLPYTSEEYYDTSEYSDDEGPLDYQYLRDEKPPGFAKTAEEALKNAEELIREEEEQKRRLEKKKTKNKRKRTKNRKRKQANKIKTSSERDETAAPDIKDKPDELIPPMPPPPKPKAQSMGNGDTKPNTNSQQTPVHKPPIIPNGKVATTNSTQQSQQPSKPNSKKVSTQPSPKPDQPHNNSNQKNNTQQQNMTKQKNSAGKQDTNKRNSTHEDTTHRESHNQTAFVTVYRKKKKAFSTSGITSNGSLSQSPQTLPSHKTQVNGTSHAKQPPPPQTSSKSADHFHAISSPPHVSPTSPNSVPFPAHTLAQQPSKPVSKELSNTDSPNSRPHPANKPSNSSQDLSPQQFNPIFNPMPSPYVEPYSEERGTLANTAHVDEAIHLAEHGNEFASQEQFTLAIEKFTSAIFYNPKEYRYFGNRSLCYERLGDFETALVDADKAIELKMDWPKGYFRRARALRGLKRFSEAEAALSNVQALQGVSEDLECEMNLVRTLQLQEYGFTASQSEKAMKRCTTYQQAIDLLIHGQISDSEDDNVYRSDEDDPGYKRMFDNPSWSVPGGPYQSFHPQGASHPLSKHHSTSSAQPGNVRQLGLTEEPGTVASLWVGNIDVHMSEKELSELFSGIGRIQSVYFLPKIQGKNRAAFVNFTRADDAANAINALQGVEKYGKCLLLRYPDNPKPPESLPGGKVTCKFWLQGRCVRGNKCAFVHPRKSK